MAVALAADQVEPVDLRGEDRPLGPLRTGEKGSGTFREVPVLHVGLRCGVKAAELAAVHDASEGPYAGEQYGGGSGVRPQVF
ncbi:hypothetical protein [Streptomyces sp. NBC_00454]|uniref:hypothetical protein n=1 Tax=Streptomyces sp. NBC_00454 TaxID=2975747 RepID=UPI0030E09E55